MAIADREGSRGARSCSSSSAEERALLSALSQRFVLSLLPLLVDDRPRRNRREPDVRRHRDAPGPGARARARRARGPSACRVSSVVSDGADTSDAAIDEPLGQHEGALDPGLHARHRSGALRQRHPGDARRERLARVLKGTSLVVEVVLSQTGYGGQTVPLSVEDDGRMVSSQEVEYAGQRRIGHGAGALHRRREAGRGCSGSGAGAAGEQVTQNNARDALIEVDDRAREGPVLRRRAALGNASSSAARSRTTRISRRHRPAADGREQILPAER